MLTFLTILILAIVLTAGFAGWRGAPWVPTVKLDVERLAKLAKLKRGERAYDLGCGDGRVVVALARTKAKVVGLEVSLVPYVAAKLRLLGAHLPNASVHWANLWRTSLADADLVYVFLTPSAYARLRPKLEAELRPGSRVITYAWPIEGWKPVSTSRLAGQLPLYSYVR